ncbi:L-2-amino-thiazoline-4-carboxylic acid hydrolase [Fuchsiella alkaliacetigena]|uniref:L-2-amino-thiazoline-4-carboxylic acid hydrolase n=1 Tax=Fuchsiella alkaliacetigena TaxID=957042 RepID=UPI00200A1A91|nr:L-2-amino-thiazoline-4-carboxylic acid hydrolase [Fuchsiella alkaliacetigena]MCK8824761.1 L-2-amino-thiazoline-4-carboxylic acid hydrolase [Fuchsiella alkaliacetigena]
MEKTVQYLRDAIADRATWFYLLIEEMEKEGYPPEKIARRAVFNFGCLKAEKMKYTTELKTFIEEFTASPGQEVFAMEVKELNPQKAVLEFEHCPLVKAWQDLGCTVEETDYLCEWAVEGDYGVISQFPSFELEIESRIGAGAECCRLIITKLA